MRGCRACFCLWGGQLVKVRPRSEVWKPVPKLLSTTDLKKIHHFNTNVLQYQNVSVSDMQQGKNVIYLL